MAKEMTLDEAIEILKGSISNPRFAEAKKFVMDNASSNPEAKAALEAALVKEREYEAENNLSSDDIKVYEENTEALNELADSYTFDDLTQDEDVGNIVDHVVVYETERDKDGQPVQTSEGPAEKMLSKEESRKYTSLIFDAATLKAKMHLTGDATFSTLDAETKAKRYKGLVNRIFFTDLAVTAVAGAVDTKSIPQIGTKEYEEHISKNAEQAMEAFVDAAQDGQNVNILAEHILASVADTAQKVEVYANKLREKAKKLAGNARTKLNEISVGFNTRLNKLEDKADKVSKGLYKKLMKPVLTSMRDNRVQIVGNAAATVALTAALVTPAAPVALGAYGAYFAATSWVYPIVERARRNNRKKKKKGEEKLKFKDAWREAKDQLLAKTVKVTDEKTGETKDIENKERKKYIRRAAIKSALGLTAFTGIAVAAQTGSGFLPLSWLTRKLLRKGDVAELGTRAGIIGTKMVVTNTAQATEVGVALGAVSKNASAENKQDLKNAAIGFGVGLAASALTQVLTGNTELFSSKGDELSDQIVQNGGVENLGDGKDFVAAADSLNTPADTLNTPADTLNTPADTTGLNNDTPIEGVATQGPVFDNNAMAPEAWTKDMGITKSEYLADMRKENNVDEYFKYYHYRLHNEDIMPRNAYEHAWMKLSQDGIMNRFPEGTTKEQVITQYFAMFGHFRRTGMDLVAGAASLPKDAFWEHSEEMNQMYQFLFCDEKAENISDETIAHIMNAKEYMLGHSDADNHNVITEFKQDCADTGKGSRWTGRVEKPVEVKVEEPVVERKPLPKLTRAAVPTGQVEYPDTSDIIEQPHPVTEEKEAMARIFGSRHPSDNRCADIKGQKVVPDEQVRSMVESKGR